ncbi:MAG: ATP-binding protein [Methanomicrobiaceae archaeon]|nr:ATP-binding protein [Methanomicrobiaceae archaeon]
MNQTAPRQGRKGDPAWIAGILLSALITLALSAFGLSLGISIVVPHLFYLPIVLAAYRYPRYGTLFAAGLGLLYLGTVAFFMVTGLEELVAAVVRVLIFVAVGTVVSSLSGRLSEQWREAERRNRQLNSINRMIGMAARSRSLDDLAAPLLSESAALFGANSGVLYLVRREGAVETRASFGITGDLPADPSIPGYETVLLQGEPCFLESFAWGELTGSAAWVPLLDEERVVGALLLLRERGRPFSGEERSLLQTIAGEISGALRRLVLADRLESTYEEANLYLDIMAHDINNANTAAIGYSEILIDMLEGKEQEIARKILASIRRSVEIISNVSTIRRLHQTERNLFPVDLDALLAEEAEKYPETSLTVTGTAGTVLADDLLGEVFTNLIGNSIKFGGPDVEITVTARPLDGMVEVAVMDTGPGIPDAEKSTLFARFAKGKSRKSGKGLGLYISRMLIEGYGGRIWAEDRVPGKPEEGAAIRFTLPRAGEATKSIT